VGDATHDRESCERASHCTPSFAIVRKQDVLDRDPGLGRLDRHAALVHARVVVLLEDVQAAADLERRASVPPATSASRISALPALSRMSCMMR